MRSDEIIDLLILHHSRPKNRLSLERMDIRTLFKDLRRWRATKDQIKNGCRSSWRIMFWYNCRNGGLQHTELSR